MKKILFLFSVIPLFIGCSISAENNPTEQLVLDSEQAITALNHNSNQAEKINQLYQEIHALTSDLEKINKQQARSGENQESTEKVQERKKREYLDTVKEINKLLDESDQLLHQYLKRVTEVKNQIPAYEKRAEKLEDVKAKELAIAFLSDLQAVTEKEIEVTQNFQKIVKTDKEFFQQLLIGIKTTPEVYISLQDQYEKNKRELNNQIKKLNQSWNAFSTHVATNQKQKKHGN